MLNFETETYFYIKMNHAREHNEMIIYSLVDVEEWVDWDQVLNETEYQQIEPVEMIMKIHLQREIPPSH